MPKRVRRKRKPFRLQAIGKSSLLFLLFFFTSTLFGASLEEATEREREGDLLGALSIYDSWLDGEEISSSYVDILIYSASLESNGSDTRDRLLKYCDRLDPEGKRKVYQRVARLYELEYNIEDAARYYGLAAIRPDGTKDLDCLLRKMELEYQMGIIPPWDQLNTILLGSSSPEILFRGTIFMAEILKSRGDTRASETLLFQSQWKDQSPELNYALWELYDFTGEIHKRGAIASFLRKQFPQSLELALIEGRVSSVERLSDLFLRGPKPIEKSVDLVYLQLGSYTLEKGAHILMDELKEKGYVPKLVQTSAVYRVYICSPRGEDSYIKRLRQLGYKPFVSSYPCP